MRKIWEALPIEAKVAIIIPAVMAWTALLVGMAIFVVVLAFKVAGLS